MPITLQASSRRGFLAAGTALVALHRIGASECVAADGAERPVDPHRTFLFSDSHIPATAETELRGVNMTGNLTKAIADALSLGVRPAAAFLSGDCAMLDGQPGDYTLLAKTVQPLLDTGAPMHFALGNHDDRANFRAGANLAALPHLLEEKHVVVVETPRANWYVLDSLDEVNKSPGKLGDKQCQWLADELDRRPDKPALIVVHHNPGLGAELIRGLTDTPALYEKIVGRKQVKAIFFGHSHAWGLREHESIHLVNLPPTAYVFADGLPSGWVDVAVEETGAKLTLRSLDASHKEHGRVVDLKWRA